MYRAKFTVTAVDDAYWSYIWEILGGGMRMMVMLLWHIMICSAEGGLHTHDYKGSFGTMPTVPMQGWIALGV